MPPVRTDARVEDTVWVVDDVKRDMEQDSTDARYPDPGDVANPCVSTSVAGTEMTAVAPGAGSGCAAGLEHRQAAGRGELVEGGDRGHRVARGVQPWTPGT